MIETKKKKVLKNREIVIEIRGTYITDATILHSYDEGIKIEEACRKGCPNYGNKWSCPPYAKRISDIIQNFTKGYLLSFSTEMKYYADIKNPYLAVKAANASLKSEGEKIARSIEAHVGGYALLSGSCRLCKPCQCKKRKPCKRPEQMRYSMEATAINVERLCMDLLSRRLLWYQNKELPAYTSVVVLALMNSSLETDEALKILEI